MNKISLDNGFTSSKIPQLLNTIYYCLIKEESWSFIKEHKDPVINFKTLKQLTFSEIKKHLNHIF